DFVGANIPGAMSPERIIAHAVLGCVQQASSGGQCGPGAAAAAFGKIATGLTQGLGEAAQFVATTVVGGTVSVIGGGKFANGAAQAGFGYLFNNLSRIGQPSLRLQVESAIVRGDMQQLRNLLPGLSGDAAVVVESILARDAMGTAMTFSREAVQHATKHAAHFGLNIQKESSSPAALAELQAAIANHVTAAGTRAIHGTYRGTESVTHFLNPQTGLNVIRDLQGNFQAAFRLGSDQLKNVLTHGGLK
ncbi:MAG: colicin D domain-containing protein, partial [Betaproteobacteria bacterium]